MIHKSIIGLFLILGISMSSFAQEGNKANQQKNDSMSKQMSGMDMNGMNMDSSESSMNMNQKESAFMAYQKAHNTGTLADFPRLHPMIVHFPIVLLLLAFLAQLCSLFFFKKELSWAALLLVVGGFIGAYLASNVFHGGDPDLKLLDAISRSTFEKHELFASYTVWISGIAALLKILSQFVFKKHLIAEVLVTILLAGSAYTIAVTGDMGARLVHIDTIGVQCNKIPAHDND